MNRPFRDGDPQREGAAPEHQPPYDPAFDHVATVVFLIVALGACVLVGLLVLS